MIYTSFSFFAPELFQLSEKLNREKGKRENGKNNLFTQIITRYVKMCFLEQFLSKL